MTLDVRTMSEPGSLKKPRRYGGNSRTASSSPFINAPVDPVRIELDERVVRDLLGLGEDAVAAVARLRILLASDPSIHGSKKPALPG